MGIATIIVSIGRFEDRDRIQEPFPVGRKHWALRDLTAMRDGWGGTMPEAMLFGGAIPDLAWDDFAGWLENQEWEDPESIEVLFKDPFADWFEVWRMSSDGTLVQVLSANWPLHTNNEVPELKGTEGFTSFENSDSWTMGWPASESTGTDDRG
jgi:hypothetical protein